MATPIVGNIKQIDLDSAHGYEIEALHFITGSLDTPAQWKTYIDNLVGKGLEIKVVTTLPTASASTMGKLYLVAETGAKAGTYVEYVTVNKGTDASPDYAWEKIGTTDTDLSDYVKHGTYNGAAQTGGPTVTGEAGAHTATGSVTVTYKKSAEATGSAGAGSAANTGNAGAATVSVTGASFSGTAATITSTGSYTPAGTVSKPGVSLTKSSKNFNTDAIKAVTSTFSGTEGSVSVSGSVTAAGTVASHSHSVTASGTIKTSASTATTPTYQPTGTISAVTAAAHSHAVNAETESATVVTGVNNAASAGAHTHAVDSHEHGTNVAAVIGIPNFSGGSASGTFVTDVKTAGSASLSANDATATGRVKYVESITGGSASGTFNTGAIKSISGTKNYGFAALQATIATTIKTNNYGFASSTSDVMYAPTVTNGVLSWSTKAAGTTIAMNSVAASTQDAHTGDAAGTASVSYTAPSATTKYLGISHSDPTFNTGSVAWTAASLGTLSTTNVAAAPSAKTLTAASAGAHTHSVGASGSKTITYMTSATLGTAGGINITPTFTGGKVDITFTGTAVNTSSVAPTFSGSAVSVTSTGKFTPAGTIGNTYTAASTDSVNNVTAAALDATPTFTGTSATITVKADYTPAGSVTGGQVTIAAHSHSYTAPSAHTHAITLTDTNITGSFSAAIGNHTHSIAQHTHNVVL